MKKYLLSLAVMAMGASLITGCQSNDSEDFPPGAIVMTKGVFVLNKGNINQGVDGSLTYLETTTGKVTGDIYKEVNGRSLGGTVTDVMVYGEKVYVVGSDENTIFVLKVRNGKEIKLVSTTELLGDAEGVQPRCIAAYGDKVYFTTYGGYVAAIDTINFKLQAQYQVGSYPEGLSFGTAPSSGSLPKLYVANSDWGMGKGSISCIDLNSATVTEFKNDKVTNPQEFAVAEGKLYVLDHGYYDENYNQHDAGIYRINGNDAQLVVPNATGMTAYGNYLFTYNDPWGGTGPTYTVYNIMSDIPTPLTLSGDADHRLISPCAIGFDPNTGYIYIGSRQLDPDNNYPSEALPGFVNIYDSNGQFQESFSAGVEPRKFDFFHELTRVVL